jgi:type IV pilus assembly protein PilX
MKAPLASSRAQRGASLIIVLLFLVMLSVLGITEVRTSSLEEKMTGNERDRQVAFEAAESALRDAEREIFQSLGASSPFTSGCINGLCMPSTTAVAQWDAVDWMSATPRTYGAFSGAGAYPVADLARAPRYIIELLPPMPPSTGNSVGLGARPSTSSGTPYRITAVGWGRRPSTQVTLQSVFVKL